MSENQEERYRPRDVADAAAHLLTQLSDEQRDQLRAMTERDLIGLHFSLGLYLRNNYDLEPLVQGYRSGARAGDRAPGLMDTDGVSSAIIRAVWQRLRR